MSMESKRSSSSFPDKNGSKRQKDTETDMPIYLQFIKLGRSQMHKKMPEYEWLVIEEKQTPPLLVDHNLDELKDELKDDEWVLKSQHDRVSHLKLPYLDYQVGCATFLVSKSRLFFLGDHTGRDDIMVNAPNGIVSIDLCDNDSSWQICVKWNPQLHNIPNKVGIYRCDKEEDDWICVLMPEKKEMLLLDCRDLEIGGKLVPIPTSFPIEFWGTSLLACTHEKMLLFTPEIPGAMNRRMSQITHIHWFDMKSRSYEVMCVTAERMIWDQLRDQSTISVVVDQFVISFSIFSPYPMTFGCYCPRLYVYDTKLLKWLIEPVQGLPNDGRILPLLEDELLNPVQHMSLFQIRKKENKFALIWSGSEDLQGKGITDIHWSKFNLNIENTSCIIAEKVSSGICLAGETWLSNSAVG